MPEFGLLIGDVETYFLASAAVRRSVAEATERYDQRELEAEQTPAPLLGLLKRLWASIRRRP
jgi:hypothetical protein